MEKHGLIIAQVEKQSIAEELGIKPGDRLVYINNEPVEDILDYRFLCAGEEITATVITGNGEEWQLEIEKDFEEDLGLDFGVNSFGPTRRCHNKCIFCFVDQMAPSMRETLYIKDDDYRLSFWQGNFVSLTNLSDKDLQRIITQKMGPLYISVHTTNPELRCSMLNNRFAGKIMDQLKAIAGAGIEMHTQVVLCPGVNDGQELERTIKDLANLWPEVQSLAVVPVGVTRYRDSLYPLRPFQRTEAATVVNIIQQFQEKFIGNFDYPFVYASDEFYLLSGEPIPASDNYADFPQLENGVGLVRLFLDEWEVVETELPRAIKSARSAVVVTGVSGAAVMNPVVERLNEIKGLTVNLIVVPNRFFGETVTVTGLLTGQDILQALGNKIDAPMLIIPSIMLREGEDVFLDDLTVGDLSERLKVPVVVVQGPKDLVKALLED